MIQPLHLANNANISIKKSSLIVILCLVRMLSFAQTDIGFSADRPGEATGPDVMPLRKVQWETGVGWSRHFDTDKYTINSTLFRYGLTRFAELRIGIDLLHNRTPNLRDYTTGLSALAIGTKARVLNGHRAMPTVAILAELQCPHIGSSQFTPDHLAPSLYLLFNNDIFDWLGIGYSVGSEWDGSVPVPIAFLAVTLSFSPIDNLGLFIESYNRFSQYPNQFLESKREHSIDFGVTWMVHPRVQIDVATNMNLQRPSKYFAISGGMAWLIN